MHEAELETRGKCANSPDFSFPFFFFPPIIKSDETKAIKHIQKKKKTAQARVSTCLNLRQLSHSFPNSKFLFSSQMQYRKN